jgi:ariadne-1
MDSPDDVLRSAGEPQPPLLDTADSYPYAETNHAKNPGLVLCDICLDSIEPNSHFELRCRHAFCQTCWKIYVTHKIKAEGQSIIKCMQEGCPTVVDEPSVISLLDRSNLVRLEIISLVFSSQYR